MADAWQPTDAQIDALLVKFTPRQIAIAYLRQKRKTADAELMANAHEAIGDLAISAMRGDMKSARSAVDKFGKQARTHKQTTEKDHPHG